MKINFLNLILRKKILLIGIVIFVNLFLLISFGQLDAAKPYGASSVNQENTSTATPDTPLSHAAIAGNVTELNIFGYSTTLSWQGYYGNVSGSIQLADSSDSIMYNWSLASPKGEIYSSTDNGILWTNIQCFNFSATGTYADDSANRGGTSQYGMNLSQLESSFNINSSAADGVNETFALNSTPEAHDTFYTNSLEFGIGECPSTFVYDNTGQGVDGKFEEVLLYDPDQASVVFTSLLEEDASGFDSKSHDFEMLVLEDGHGADTSTTNYYFYVELQ